MNPYLALISLDLKLALRQKSVLFFNYLFPLIFLVVFGQLTHGDRGGGMTQIMTMVIMISVLGNGLFGAGIRAVQEREANILRRYKVTPIGPAPLLVAQTAVGWILFIPFVVLLFGLSHYGYGMDWPRNMLSILIFVSLGILAFRAIGMILAAVANSMQESQIMVQLIYLPMLLLSGATFPSWMFPSWLLIVTQFLPATYLVSGVQGMLLKQESIMANWMPSLALVATTILGLFIAFKLFRWEKEEKIRSSAKLWVGAVMLPFLVLGVWQAHSQQNVAKTRILNRALARSETYLIRGARIFVGDGRVYEVGSILIRKGKIAEVYEGAGPSPEEVHATVVEAAGTTILPGLIDAHVHLAAPGGMPADPSQYDVESAMKRHLSAYLYSGVTTVRSVGDPLDMILKVRSEVNGGERLGAELLTCGPLFTAKGGHGTEYFKEMPERVRETALQQFTRTPASTDEARRQVDDLKAAGVDCIKGILESGTGSDLFNRLDTSILNTVVSEAHANGLPAAVHTGDARDVSDAVAAKADSIEHGSAREPLADSILDQMARQKTAYDPTLSVIEALHDFQTGKTDLLRRSLAQQVGPAELFESTIKAMQARQPGGASPSSLASLDIARENLKRAYQHGVTLVTGSDAGNVLVIHGPTVQREVELWVEAGISPTVALQAATLNSALLLRQSDRIGTIEKGKDANLLIVDGNPLQDITAIERISQVVFKGERISRADLFNQD